MPKPKKASARDLQMMLDALNGDGLCKAVAVQCPVYFQPETNPLAVGVMNVENYIVHRLVCVRCLKVSTSLDEIIAKGYSEDGTKKDAGEESGL
jgi:hypothetical protein